MKPTRLIKKSFAIILLLVFAQKTGAELYFHNWFHSNKYEKSAPRTPAKNVVGYSCNCIDDFSMPFADNAERPLQIISFIGSELTILHKYFVSSSSAFFFCLRAPPTLLMPSILS